MVASWTMKQWRFSPSATDSSGGFIANDHFANRFQVSRTRRFSWFRMSARGERDEFGGCFAKNPFLAQ
jgi:hypothetical protein